MYKLKESKFSVLCEDIYNRFQSGGLVSGDIVKFRKNTLSNATIKGLDEAFKTYLTELMNSDLNLKVGAVKTIRPTAQYNMANTVYGYSVDVVQEYAPGMFKTPITVPIEVLERVDSGADRQPVPDSLRRKEKINIQPEEAADYHQPNK